MRKFLTVAAFLFFSMVGGAIGQGLGFSNVALGAYQMLAVWTGAAGGPIPNWVHTYYGFDGNITNSMNNGLPFFSVSPNGTWAGAFATRSSDSTGTAYPSGTNWLCVHDNPTTLPPAGVWCQYVQAVQTAASKNGTQIWGVENSGWNEKTPVTNVDPFNLNVGTSMVNYRFDCGVGPGHTSGLTNCTSAIHITNNQKAYASPAIVVGDGAQDVSVDPSAPFMAFPDYNSIAGYHSSGVVGYKIFGGVGSPAGTVSCTARCLYIREDGGAGSTLYINETGGGTSGWSAK